MKTSISKTQMRLMKAFTDLLQMKPFAQITVNDVCAEAMVGRSTFYDHFQDKYALLSTTLEYASNIRYEHVASDSLALRIEKVFQGIHEQHPFINNLFNAQLDREVLAMVRDVWVTYLERHYEDEFEDIAPADVPRSFLMSYVSGAFVSTFQMWIESGYKETPKAMAQYHMACLQGLKENKSAH